MTDQERAKQEDLMARGPVSRGAENTTAPMNQGQQKQAHKPRETDAERNKEDYDKLIHMQSSGTSVGRGMAVDREVGSVGGGDFPSQPTPPRGGRNTSNSTVGGGGTSAGAEAGLGQHRDRGSMPDIDVDTSTNNANTMNRQEGGKPQSELPRQPAKNAQPGPAAAAKSSGEEQNPSEKHAHKRGPRETGINKETTDPMTSRLPHKLKHNS
ncbi:hypothetical protein EPA93_34080 [Ktedonosporobacter rubrisoli]|uniref:Uncharacterized protein n=1 Tax=Ktedonosporobacter rubrisoli TaxID=2509675 RepID=A0A4V0YZS4_KTERU|nr:hypothetical protein [Ktedonosporobacter rubrisoli]QBD80731.1 hypothetical protein EPA93_34080 [Ktedonosporobacter rubrisoli]